MNDYSSKSIIRAPGTRGANDKWVMTDFNHYFTMIENYIYVYHTGMLVAIPTYPASLQDTMQVQYQASQILSRSAPIFSYSYSGPRTMQIDLELHRDMMASVRYIGNSMNIKPGENSLTPVNDDYIDTIIKELQAIALPKYDASQKMVDPPMVAARFGDEVFIKGIVSGPVNCTYKGPILQNNKYAQVSIAFGIQEVDPYDADSVMQFGSLRGFSTDLERNTWKTSSYSSNESFTSKSTAKLRGH